MTDNAVFEAILAMDSYNQGYGPAVFNVGKSIGDATVIPLSNTLAANPLWQDAGFYAVAYNWNGAIVISYRGTDNISGVTVTVHFIRVTCGYGLR